MGLSSISRMDVELERNLGACRFTNCTIARVAMHHGLGHGRFVLYFQNVDTFTCLYLWHTKDLQAESWLEASDLWNRDLPMFPSESTLQVVQRLEQPQANQPSDSTIEIGDDRQLKSNTICQ